MYTSEVFFTKEDVLDSQQDIFHPECRWTARVRHQTLNYPPFSQKSTQPPGFELSPSPFIIDICSENDNEDCSVIIKQLN